MIEAVYNFDLAVFRALDAVRTPALDRVMSVITHAGDAGIIWIVLSALLLIFRRTRPCGVALAFSLVACLLLNNLLLKNLVARPRPFVSYDIEALIAHPSGASFPSGHTASSFAGALALALTLARRYPLGAGLGRVPAAAATAGAYLLAATIAFSRIWLRVHYCTDVLAGVLTGSLCALIGVAAAAALMRRLCRPREKDL